MANESLTSKAGARPWHVEVGWDGGLTAIVDVEGYLVAECEGPRGGYTLPTERGAAAENAKLIVAAVNSYRPSYQQARAIVEAATVRETEGER